MRDQKERRTDDATGRRRAAVASVSMALALGLAAVPAAAGDEAPTKFRFVLEEGKLVEGPAVLRVVKGARVELNWRSDRAVEIHLHGYDVLLPVGVGETAAMRLHATATGRFPLSLHGGGGAHSRKPLAYLEVHPD